MFHPSSLKNHQSHSISIPSSQFLLFLFFGHWVELSWGWDEGVELSLPKPINSPSHPRTAQAPHQKPVCPLKRATSPRETRRGGKSWKYLQFSSRAQLNGVEVSDSAHQTTCGRRHRVTAKVNISIHGEKLIPQTYWMSDRTPADVQKHIINFKQSLLASAFRVLVLPTNDVSSTAT